MHFTWLEHPVTITVAEDKVVLPSLYRNKYRKVELNNKLKILLDFKTIKFTNITFGLLEIAPHLIYNDIYTSKEIKAIISRLNRALFWK